MYTPFSIKWLDQQTQTSQRWQMGSILLYMFCPLEPQKSCKCFWRNIGVWGERKVEKDGETAGVRKWSDTHRCKVSHIFTFRAVRNVTGCITLSVPASYRKHIAWNGGRFWGPHHRQDSKSSGTLQLANSHCKQGPQDTGSPPTVTRTPPAMSPSHADIISFWKGHLLHLEGTKEPTRTRFMGGCCQKVQLCSREGKTRNL